MRFMLMMQGTGERWQRFLALPAADIQAHRAFSRRLREELRGTGELVSDEGLAPPVDALIVQACPAGLPAIVRAPFPESKEFVAGYWVIDGDAERAIQVATRISVAPGRGGAPLNMPVEVRKVMRAPGEDV